MIREAAVLMEPRCKLDGLRACATVAKQTAKGGRPQGES